MRHSPSSWILLSFAFALLAAGTGLANFAGQGLLGWALAGFGLLALIFGAARPRVPRLR